MIERIFEKNKFDAAYSKSLARNNDARSAIARKLYELYDPSYLVSVYNDRKEYYLNFIKNKGKEFEDKVNRLIVRIEDTSKLKSILIPEKKIEKDLITKRINFVLENIEDIKSQDIFDYYDTRNYDLVVMLEGIDNTSLVKLYNDLKKKIMNNELKTDTCITGEYNDKKSYMLDALLNTFIEVIAKRELEVDYKNDKVLRRKLFKNIALEYFGENIDLTERDADYKKNLHTFTINKEIFDLDSNYKKLKDIM